MLLLPGGAAALWAASRLPWGTRPRPRPGTDATLTVDIPGSEVAPALVPLAVLALAGIAGVVAVGGIFRRILGSVFAAAGVVPIWLGVNGPEVSGFTWGRTLAVIGGVLMVAAGIVLLARSNRLPRLGARYQSPSVAKEFAQDDSDLWSALSEGDDPTARDR